MMHELKTFRVRPGLWPWLFWAIGCVSPPEINVAVPMTDMDPDAVAADATATDAAATDAAATDAAAIDACVSVSEVCDGVDNDCNGSVDDLVTDDEGPCAVGVGVCRVAGEERCVRGELVCNAVSDAPSDERCDDLDNDCDGATDEEDPGGGAPCMTGEMGACGAGRTVCQAGALACVREVGPSDEDCDGVDNDCDGEVDNSMGATCCVGDEVGPPCNGCPGMRRVPDGWACVPPGSFDMGSSEDGAAEFDSERPQHRVRITGAFLLMTTEVTQAQWFSVFGNRPSGNVGRELPCGDCPVENINWFEAAAYTNALSRAEMLPECYRLTNCQRAPGEVMVCDDDVGFEGLACLGYRFPTEAEWEYATRAGTTTLYWTGDDPEALDDVAWNESNNAVDGVEQNHPVGQLLPNPWGLFDVHGNVFERVHDWYEPYEAGEVEDPTGGPGPPVSRLRAARGGAFNFPPVLQRAALRLSNAPDAQGAGVGLRVARSDR